MKGGFLKIARRIASIDARLADSGAGQQFRIPAHSGMVGLLAAIRQAKEARQGAPCEPPVYELQSPFARLRMDILAERERREKWLQSRWKELCDGKRLFLDLQNGGHLRVSAAILKKQITLRMKDTESENWKHLDQLLRGMLAGA